MTIKALRLLPPLAFTRFGSAPTPQTNYDIEVDHTSLGFRKIRSGRTLIVAKEGKLTIRDPALQRAEPNEIFRDGPHIRQVAPFFELFAIMEEDQDKLVPVTLDLLKKCNLGFSNVQWKVHVENRKVFRRTGDRKDKVIAATPWFGDHAQQWLTGTCDNCLGSINFGYVQFVEPDLTDQVSSHARLRFTPAPGKIYGPIRGKPDAPQDDEPHVIPIYQGTTWPGFDQAKPGNRKVSRGKKESEGDETWPRETLPPSLYANTNKSPAAPWLNHDRAISRGYLDDACDGFIYVKIDALKGPDGKPLQTKARICVGPPAFVPDSRFVRTLSDDLDQVVNGPNADDLDVAEARERALDIVRRSSETVRFMNVAVMNGNSIDGRPAEEFDTMPAEEAFTTERPVRPVMAPASADTAAILGLHQHIFAAVSCGAAPWFLRLLRRPDEIGDLTDQGRRKMPALMSGADSFYLALTYRQIATIEKAAEGDMFDQVTPLLACSATFGPADGEPNFEPAVEPGGKPGMFEPVAERSADGESFEPPVNTTDPPGMFEPMIELPGDRETFEPSIEPTDRPGMFEPPTEQSKHSTLRGGFRPAT